MTPDEDEMALVPMPSLPARSAPSPAEAAQSPEHSEESLPPTDANDPAGGDAPATTAVPAVDGLAGARQEANVRTAHDQEADNQVAKQAPTTQATGPARSTAHASSCSTSGSTAAKPNKRAPSPIHRPPPAKKSRKDVPLDSRGRPLQMARCTGRGRPAPRWQSHSSLVAVRSTTPRVKMDEEKTSDKVAAADKGDDKGDDKGSEDGNSEDMDMDSEDE